MECQIQMKKEVTEMRGSIMIRLTHFRPMFHLSLNQVVGFYQQNVWKTPVEEWHFKVKMQ